ncbi:MAG: PEP-CTERM sorting domain-containing protein [Candidatus Eisenbacteria bacterium]|uniref:PEP-CTERM sorting domain-containing protein n=1 Tax=Eiseniibacteriota bacterium TaxID=2212470 RepID=A0A7Y2EBU7_UNCEI|nr:PEP-CTERM sorting domain-containing protein [Candidatus Eisenbacteria bacterium]
MKKLRYLGPIALLACLVVIPANAMASVFNLSPFTGASADVRVLLDDTVFLDKIQVTVEVIPNPNIGDIRGVYFNLGMTNPLVRTDIVGADITDFGTDTNNLGAGTNMLPDTPYDLGVEIGTNGIGQDDIQRTVFTINDKGVLTTSSFIEFGVRLSSVGEEGSSREESSKLSGTPQTPIPEPATMSLLIGGLLAGGVLRRRRK